MTDDSLLAKLAEEFTAEMRVGKPADIEKYALKYPELAARIRELFPTLMMLEGVAGADDPASAKPPMQPGLSPDSVFGQYRIKREIGRGGMGIVYEAVHLLLEKRVALKVLPLRTTRDAGHLELFFREARTAAGLHHTNIVPVFDVGQVSGTPYYAMEYIEGRGLDVVLHIMQSAEPHEFSDVYAPDSKRETVSEVQVSSDQELQSDEGKKKTVRGSVDPSVRIRAGLPARSEEYFRWVARIGIQASEGLAHAHERKVIHCDIKPSNLLLDKQGVLWITDFGLARRLEDPAVTQSGILIGTARYMSPE